MVSIQEILTRCVFRPFCSRLLHWAGRSGTGKESEGLQRDLPAAVQKTVQANLKGGEIKNIAKEKEDGVEQYEVESVLNGKTRDFDVDTKKELSGHGRGTTIDAIPATAKAGILKR